jgi:hypothetical protein
MVNGSWFGRLRARACGGAWTAPVLPPREETPEPPSALSRLSTVQLCSLWRKSQAGLRSASTPRGRLDVVEAREVLLTELARRDPRSMEEWVATGGAEPDGPPAYLLGAAWLTGDR